MLLNRIIFAAIILISLIRFDLFAQPDSVEVYLIDSYITPETPHTFILSFFTSEKAKSKVLIDNEYEYPVSKKLEDNHQIKIDVSELEFKKENIPFIITIEDSLGNENKSEVYEVELPRQIKIKDESNFLLLCLFGGTVFLLPNPVYVNAKGKSYFSLTKEIPLISLQKQGFTYPAGYFSVEYSHIFNAPIKNFFRAGYKHIIEIPFFQYLSPGINYTTNFNGFNAVSPELSIGLFRILNTFIVYSKYRYNLKPGGSENNFHEISIGLYSNFFSLYL